MGKDGMSTGFGLWLDGQKGSRFSSEAWVYCISLRGLMGRGRGLYGWI